MKNILLIFAIVFCIGRLSSQGDVAISGTYNPSPITVGNTSQLTVNFSNNAFISYPIGEVYIQITIPIAWYSVIGNPTGTLLPYFSNINDSDNDGVWYGYNTAVIPTVLQGFAGASLTFNVQGNQVVGPNLATLFDTDFDNLNDLMTANNHTQAGLVVSAPLPVEFTRFTGETVKCDYVNLDWDLASEVNNSGFEVQRKANGGKFEKVGFVKGAGTSTKATSYSFKDELFGKFNEQNIYYRLKQLDFNGKSDYSNEIHVKPTCNPELSMKISPNPTKDLLLVSLYGFTAEEADMQILDNTGKHLRTVHLNSGLINEVVMKDLPAGVYTLRVSSEGELLTNRVIKVD